MHQSSGVGRSTPAAYWLLISRVDGVNEDEEIFFGQFTLKDWVV